MSVVIKKNVFVFWLIAITTILLGVVSSFVLPERFFYDANTIAQDPYNEAGFNGSYPLTILFYHITGLYKLPFPGIGIIQLSTIYFIVSKLGIPKNFHLLTLRNVVIYLTMVFVAIYLGMPSKEFLTFIALSPVAFLLVKKTYSRNKTVLICLMVFFLFGLFYRPYMVLIVPLSIVMFLISKIKLRNKAFVTISLALLVTIILSLSYGFIKGEFFSQSTREELNLFRKNSPDANSMITSPVLTDTWYGESISIVYGFFSVNIPINGLKFILSPQILLFVAWQTLLFILLYINLINCLQKKDRYAYELWGLFFVFSYFVIQGIFEPDLGSAMKHKTGVFLLIYLALYYDFFRERKLEQTL